MNYGFFSRDGEFAPYLSSGGPEKNALEGSPTTFQRSKYQWKHLFHLQESVASETCFRTNDAWSSSSYSSTTSSPLPIAKSETSFAAQRTILQDPRQRSHLCADQYLLWHMRSPSELLPGSWRADTGVFVLWIQVRDKEKGYGPSSTTLV